MKSAPEIVVGSEILQLIEWNKCFIENITC